MFLVRFSYDFAPSDRNEVMDLIRREVDAANAKNLKARLLVPLTRGDGAPALEYELEVPTLDSLESFREHGIDSAAESTHEWARELSRLLKKPPAVSMYRIGEGARKGS
jgi:hypothetical protein